MSELDYKLVVVTPAGRRRYMKYLIPQVVSSDVVDRYEIWVNTNDQLDLQFLQLMERKFEKIVLIEQPDGIVDGNRSINAFFKTSIQSDSIYLRLDDDICWIEPGFFSTMKTKRIADRFPFLITPLVVNNAIISHVLQQEKVFVHDKYLTADCMSAITWRNAQFAYELHNWFVKKVLAGQVDSLKVKDSIIALNRFSINSICWFGEVMRSFEGTVEGDEEEFLTVIKPRELNTYNKIIGNAVIAHYAFFPQRKILDGTDLLEIYEKLIKYTYRNDEDFITLLNEVLIIERTLSEHEMTRQTKRNKLKKVWKIKVPLFKLKCVELGYLFNKLKAN